MINWSELAFSLQWFFLLYFIAINSGYLLLNVLAYFGLRRHIATELIGELPQAYAHFKPPISLLVPAYNEASTIAASVRSLLQLTYHEFEVIVINDGSKDETLEELKREFGLVPYPEAYCRSLPTKTVHGIWRSVRHPLLRVIDKENGGKADALNAGINASHFPLFCAVDADSVLQRNSLQLLVQPFIEDGETIAAGGTVRVVNGCTVRDGFMTEVGLPQKWLSRFQVVEYLRAFLFGRLGWAPLNAMPVISGAFGLFRKTSVLAAGGYATTTVGEDMELVLRLHRHHIKQRIPYRIACVPNSVCWTEAPESLSVMKSQRSRWQRGLSESLMMNIGLLFNFRNFWMGWFAFPFFLLFEWLSPLIEIAGYFSMSIGFILGIISWKAFLAFTLVAVVLGILLSVSAMLMEEMAFHLYPSLRQIGILLSLAILENVGYRQLNLYWRTRGMLQWLFGTQAKWGTMTRSASWKHKK